MSDIVTIVETEQDRLTHSSTIQILDWIWGELGQELGFNATVDLFGTNSQPLRYEDLVALAIEYLNEEAKIGVWYSLTFDSNLIVELEPLD